MCLELVLLWCPDTKVGFTVQRDKLEFCRGKEGGWNLIGNSSDESVEDGGFVILGKIIIGMIAETEQVKGVKVFLVEETDDDEAVSRDIWPAGEPDAEDKDENTSC